MKFNIGDIVSHIKDPDSKGRIISIDENFSDVTTCNVIWDDFPTSVDIVWTNKLVKES